MKANNNIRVIDHPLALHKLTQMRKNPVHCPSRIFVQLMKEIGAVMACEVMRLIYEQQKLKMKSKSIETNWRLPDGTYLAKEFPTLPRKKPIVVPILRSGLIMAEAMKDIIGGTFTGHIGIIGQNDTKKLYFLALPEEANSLDVADEDDGSDEGVSMERRDYLLVDPVIATGETACMAIESLQDRGIAASQIFFVSLVIGSEGSRHIRAHFPGVTFFTLSTDEEMDRKRLLCGLGAVSNRQYRTEF
jgi:uracil phosphoribosyltransferase